MIKRFIATLGHVKAYKIFICQSDTFFNKYDTENGASWSNFGGSVPKKYFHIAVWSIVGVNFFEVEINHRSFELPIESALLDF